MKTLRTARRYLTAIGESKEGLTDEQIIALAVSHGMEMPTLDPKTAAPATPAPATPAPATPSSDSVQLALTQLMAAMSPQAPQLDEAAIEKLVKKYSNQATTLKIEPLKPAPPVTINGAHKELARVIKRLNGEYKVYLYGPAGAGKTTLARQAAEALAIPFYHTGALLQKYELTGFNDAGGAYVSTTFYEAYKNGGLYLFDEVDASQPQAVIAFNQAIENGEMTFPNEVVEQHANFRVIAAANTNGQGATANYKRNALDGATLDRFVRIGLQYDEKMELAISLAEYARQGGTQPEEAENWVSLVQRTRQKALNKKIDVIISPRSSKNGAGILAQGDDTKTAISETFGASLSKDQYQQLDLGSAL